jgi:hypothetical protein
MSPPIRREPIVALVVLNTDDPRLDPQHLDVSTKEATAALRQAVIDALPSLSRVVQVLPESEARLMLRAHDIALREIAGGQVNRPPADYIAPADRKH